MHDEYSNGLIRAERDALTSLPHEQTPPRELEDRTVSVLKEHGLIRERRMPWWALLRLTGAVAALLVAFGIGLTIGGRTPPPGAEAKPTQMLFLYYPPGMRGNMTARASVGSGGGYSGHV
ncbi:MAG: hypothetical protein ACE5EO_03005 [Candidatus Krumholzibacteriia bacterium]